METKLNFSLMYHLLDEETNLLKKNEYVYKSTVRDVYGLTPSMIDELGPPDKLVRNRHNSNAPCASLYLVKRVEEWVARNQERVERAKVKRAKIPRWNGSRWNLGRIV